jgi:hypothetical protein
VFQLLHTDVIPHGSYYKILIDQVEYDGHLDYNGFFEMARDFVENEIPTTNYQDIEYMSVIVDAINDDSFDITVISDFNNLVQSINDVVGGVGDLIRIAGTGVSNTVLDMIDRTSYSISMSRTLNDGIVHDDEKHIMLFGIMYFDIYVAAQLIQRELTLEHMIDVLEIGDRLGMKIKRNVADLLV